MTDGVSDQAQAPPLISVLISEPLHVPPILPSFFFGFLPFLVTLLLAYWTSFALYSDYLSRFVLLSQLPHLCWHVSVLLVYHILNHHLRSSSHLKISTFHTRQVSLPLHLSFLLSMLLRFYRSSLSSYVRGNITPLSPTTTFCSRWFTRCCVWCIVETLSLQLRANSFTIPVKIKGRKVRLRTVPHQLMYSPESPES